MANFKLYSRYFNGTVATNRSGQNFLLLRQPLNLGTNSRDTFVTITKEIENRPDILASQLYGNPDLWWVIYEFNGISDPFFELKAGQILRIPELERVLSSIRSLES